MSKVRGFDVIIGNDSRGAAEANLGPAFEDADEHDVGDPDGAEAEEQAVQGALRVGERSTRLRVG